MLELLTGSAKEPKTLIYRFRESRYPEEKRGVNTPWRDLPYSQ